MKFRCTECDHRFEANLDTEPWPDECSECDYYYCGDEMCCYGLGFLPAYNCISCGTLHFSGECASKTVVQPDTNKV